MVLLEQAHVEAPLASHRRVTRHLRHGAVVRRQPQYGPNASRARKLGMQAHPTNDIQWYHVIGLEAWPGLAWRSMGTSVEACSSRSSSGL
eukprot:4363055-Amphidinium_carterae.1